MALDTGLLQKLNNKVLGIVRDGLANNQENKADQGDENGYLQTCYNLSYLYNNLVHKYINLFLKNDDKFNKIGITANTINILDSFNDKVESKD